jgi:hypothetical protein
VWVLKCAPRTTKKGNDFGQLEHLKLKGHKVKQILVFCKNQSVLGESYYGIEHISNGSEHISNGRTHQQHLQQRRMKQPASRTVTAALLLHFWRRW